MSGVGAGGFSYISEFHTTATAARAAAFASIAFAAIWLVMSPVALLIIPMDWSFYIHTLEYKPWRLFLTCLSFISLWNAFVFTFLPESPKFLLAMNRKEEALHVLRRAYAFNTGQPKEVFVNHYLCNLITFARLFHNNNRQTIIIFIWWSSFASFKRVMFNFRIIPLTTLKM